MLTKEQIRKALESYQGISDCIRNNTPEGILQSIAVEWGLDQQQLGSSPMGGYSKGRTSGAYWFVLRDLKQNIDSYDWLYERLYDEESKRVFYKLVSFRLFPDLGFIAEAYDGKHAQYFDKGIVQCDENEIFVDCGGFVGDTIQSYRKEYGEYKKCYIYEPDKENVKKIRKNLDGYHDITIRNAGVGDHMETASFAAHSSSGNFLERSKDGVETSLISLDEDIKESVTFIKMDVEGFEIPALIGAKNHIVKDRPKLAICLYHIVSDLWEIPRIIDSLCPDYRFFIRHYEKEQNWETVLYAIPPEKQSKKKKRLHTAVTVMPYERPWHNVELIKDCGLIPYLLHKDHGMDVSMIGASENQTDYPYAGLVKGMKLKSLKDHKIQTKLEYLAEHAREIDLLILRGGYDSCAAMALVYKDHNPEGKIYCGLDANSWWMDQIPWYVENYRKFIEICDIMATSCTAMAELLTHKWHRKIEVVTNGYYDFSGEERTRTLFGQKENVIFTAGRLGTEQKATDVLLKAFALIADDIPGWRLRLAGTIEDGFRSFIEGYFTEYPEIKERVDFLGSITDRSQMREEYENAKIFALTSSIEGGSPNVISEALSAGCVTAVTKFDAWEDCIGNGICGSASAIGDVKGFAEILKGLCLRTDLSGMSDQARLHADEFFCMQKNVDRIYRMLAE